MRVTALRTDSGFSLVEALVASLLLAIGLTGAAQVLAVSITMQIAAREAATASVLADAKLRELRQLSFDAAATQITPAGVDSLASDVPGYFDIPLGGMTRRWRVAAGPASGTRRVMIRVVSARVPDAAVVEVVTVVSGR